jgi:multidrug efflux pump subunit AcrA (membrane-fusion protein)
MTDKHPDMIRLQDYIDQLRILQAQSVARRKVYAQADGVVAEVKVQDGQTVKKGDLLVQLDAAETALELQAADVRAQQARIQLDRLEKLKGQNTVSESEYQKAVADAKLAEIEMRRIQLRLARSRITSPADGTVRAAEGGLPDLVGKRVTAGDLLMYVEPEILFGGG